MTDVAALLSDALAVLERLAVEVRSEHLGGEGGGLCRMRGRQVMFVDLDADTASQLAQCISALRQLPEGETVFVPPAIREKMEQEK